MQIKDILQDVAAACAKRWQDGATAAQKQTRAEALAADLDALKPALKQAKLEKQEAARAFGQAKTEGVGIDALKIRMQAASVKLEQLELRRKEIETALSELFADEEETPPQPQQFSNFSRKVSGAFTVREAIATDREQWDAYAASHPTASLYHRYCWRDVIGKSFGHDTIYLLATTENGAVCGLLPLARLKSKLFGDFAVSMPFFNYGGPLADTPEVAAALLDRSVERAKILDIGHLEIRSTEKLNDWPARTDKVSMVRALPTSTNALDEEIGSKIRAQIKRAQRESPEVAIGQAELLDDFYKVFATNMRDLGTPVYSKSFFGNILKALPNDAHIIVIRLNSRPVATAFLLAHRDMMEIPWASTLRRVNAMNMNMLLYRTVLGFCVERGFKFFDFGRSTKDSATFKFKKQWGALPVQHYWHYWLNSGTALPELKPDSPKFRLLIACWQRLPVAIATLLGPHIVKNLP